MPMTDTVSVVPQPERLLNQLRGQRDTLYRMNELLGSTNKFLILEAPEPFYPHEEKPAEDFFTATFRLLNETDELLNSLNNQLVWQREMLGVGDAPAVPTRTRPPGQDWEKQLASGLGQAVKAGL